MGDESGDLVMLSVSGVQRWIEDSRSTDDLRFSSEIVARPAGCAAAAARETGGRLVFPDRGDQQRPAELGSTHDITAALAHALPALYPAAAAGLKTRADKGYVAAGIGVLTALREQCLRTTACCRRPPPATRGRTVSPSR